MFPLAFAIRLDTETIATWLPVIVALLKLTHWGMAKATALDVVVQAIEAAGAAEVKKRTLEGLRSSSGSVKRAITYAVADADPKKPPVSRLKKFLSVFEF